MTRPPLGALEIGTKRYLGLLLAVGLASICSSSSAAERITLVAGGGTDTNTTLPIPAATAKLSAPFGVDFDSDNNLYLVEMTGNRVRKLDASGLLTVIAGTGAKGNSGDGGDALHATLYICDSGNNRVLRIEK